ncbi:antibiotic biosynthesis monooxygenase [Sphingomonas sp.]|jgi:heme-degrading monooxygenase HmoA|uniref:antibiotic biosynthesis monooxygenase family protein n=1 Tax=Sphingomonas sp. TaxID=28214 RepID=UPI002D8031AB|nr:antibiotic biosynthesis monooxygenase [Sphingomonas sp.]HEU0043271.1 antibiotic biosynthesis monooxygenase [Sphingomonas sp.]
MDDSRIGQVAVIFTSQRNGRDQAGYDAAVVAMDALAAAQPGYRGMVSARGADEFGITVSYWADEASARAWRDQPDHAATRQRGRTRWYDGYTVTVARVERGYDWSIA